MDGILADLSTIRRGLERRGARTSTCALPQLAAQLL